MTVFWIIVVIIASLFLGALIGLKIFGFVIILCDDKKFFGFFENIMRSRVRFRFGTLFDERIKKDKEDD